MRFDSIGVPSFLTDQLLVCRKPFGRIRNTRASAAIAESHGPFLLQVTVQGRVDHGIQSYVRTHARWDSALQVPVRQPLALAAFLRSSFGASGRRGNVNQVSLQDPKTLTRQRC